MRIVSLLGLTMFSMLSAVYTASDFCPEKWHTFDDYYCVWFSKEKETWIKAKSADVIVPRHLINMYEKLKPVTHPLLNTIHDRSYVHVGDHVGANVQYKNVVLYGQINNFSLSHESKRQLFNACNINVKSAEIGSNSTAKYWVGLSDMENEGQYKWMLNDYRPNITFWGAGQPTAADDKRNCVYIDEKGDWYTEQCKREYYFICKFEYLF